MGRRRTYSVNTLQRHGYVFVAPSVILFSIFLIGPMIGAFDLSVYEWNLLGPRRFVGLENFRRIVDDTRVMNSFRTTIHFSLVSSLLLNVLALGYALLFSSTLLRAKNFFQSLIFLPVILANVAVGIVWQFMFQSTGVFSVASNAIFGFTVPWLTSTEIAPYSVIMVQVWKFTGYYMVIYIAGLLDIPASLFESARIDGARFFQQLRYITIPMLRHTFALAIVTSVIFTFGAFPLQYVITEGGPSRSTEVMGLLIYFQAFRFNKFGYASAISVLFFGTLFIVSYFQLRAFRSEAD